MCAMQADAFSSIKAVLPYTLQKVRTTYITFMPTNSDAGKEGN